MTHTEHHAAMEARIKACIECATTCENCFGECVRMDMPGMAKCIQLCRDCADVCLTNAQLMARGGDFHICDRCAEICDQCADECERVAGQHKGEHAELLRRCAEACSRCAESCRKMA